MNYCRSYTNTKFTIHLLPDKLTQGFAVKSDLIHPVVELGQHTLITEDF